MSGVSIHRRHRSKEEHLDRAPRSPAGVDARAAALDLILAVTRDGRALDEALDAPRLAALSASDRGLARLIAATVLRREGSLDAVLARFIERPVPDKEARLKALLRAGAAQLLLIGTPPHAAISVSVDLARAHGETRRFDKLVNAVLRRVSEQGAAILAGLDSAALDVPGWLMARWVRNFGAETATAVALASLQEAPLDITVKSDPAAWADRLGGKVLSTGTVRREAGGRIEDLSGFDEGAWWIQDAAAALPAKLLGEVAGKPVADLCAAPGGKTAQLAAAGAKVTAVDQSGNRLERLRQNFRRLKLDVETAVADVSSWQPGGEFDAVLLDAPCTTTGTIRRHPDILRLKREGDLTRLLPLQARLIDRAADVVRPGGALIYCTCSLEPEEGRDQIAAFLGRHAEFARKPVAAGECGIDAAWLTPDGDLRTLPQHGLDGFFAARLVRR